MQGIKAVSARLARLSLSLKITAVASVVTAMALLLTLGLFEAQDFQGDRAELAHEELDSARDLAAISAQVAASGDPTASAEARKVFLDDEDALSAAYVSNDGRRLSLARDEGVVELVAPATAASAVAAYRNGRLEVQAPAMVGGRRVGELTLLATDERVWRAAVRNLSVGLVLALLGAAAAGVVINSLVRRALRPLRALDTAIASVTATADFSIRVPTRSRDEVGRLTHDFNALIARLAQYDAEARQGMLDLTVARDAAEEANVMKSQFLANMSHEIRTPLNGVMGMAQVMALNDLSGPQRARLDVIQQSGAMLLSVLNDILDLSKIEAGRMELEAAAFDAAAAARDAFATFTSVAEAAGVGFSLAVAPEAEGLWEGDAVRVRQVLQNLISNALKFTREGRVDVRIDADPSAAGKSLALTVADTGVGIAPDVLPRLFQKFVQADASTTRRFGGTGLGLTICRHMAELMGGSIEVESAPGVGSTFRVRLPLPWLGEATSTPAVETAADAVELGALRVLAAEDNPTNQLVLRTVLGSLGVEPIIVADGLEAVTAWEQGDFDLVLMDVQMPQMDGVAATREIRRREAETGRARTRIVALSANAMKHQVDEYLAAGMDGHLAKPIQLERLYAALVAVAETSDPAAEAAASSELPPSVTRAI